MARSAIFLGSVLLGASGQQVETAAASCQTYANACQLSPGGASITAQSAVFDAVAASCSIDTLVSITSGQSYATASAFVCSLGSVAIIGASAASGSSVAGQCGVTPKVSIVSGPYWCVAVGYECSVSGQVSMVPSAPSAGVALSNEHELIAGECAVVSEISNAATTAFECRVALVTRLSSDCATSTAATDECGIISACVIMTNVARAIGGDAIVVFPGTATIVSGLAPAYASALTIMFPNVLLNSSRLGGGYKPNRGNGVKLYPEIQERKTPRKSKRPPIEDRKEEERIEIPNRQVRPEPEPPHPKPIRLVAPVGEPEPVVVSVGAPIPAAPAVAAAPAIAAPTKAVRGMAPVAAAVPVMEPEPVVKVVEEEEFLALWLLDL